MGNFLISKNCSPWRSIILFISRVEMEGEYGTEIGEKFGQREAALSCELRDDTERWQNFEIFRTFKYPFQIMSCRSKSQIVQKY